MLLYFCVETIMQLVVKRTSGSLYQAMQTNLFPASQDSLQH